MKLVINIPTRWDDVPPDKLAKVAPWLMLGPTPDNKRRVFLLLSGMGFWTWWRLKPDTKAILWQSVNFLFDSPKLTKAPFQSFAWPFPADGLGDLPFLAFIHADVCHRNMKKGDGPAKLLACLMYDRQGNLGEQFSPIKTAERAFFIERHMPQNVQLTGLFYWLGCLWNLQKQYPALFDGEGTGKPMDGDSWGKVVFELAGQKLGTVDDVAAQNVHTVFRYLVHLKSQKPKKK